MAPGTPCSAALPTKPARFVRYAEQPRRAASMVASSAKSSDATNAAIALRRARERTKSENDDADRDRLHWCGAAARDVVLALVISERALVAGGARVGCVELRRRSKRPSP